MYILKNALRCIGRSKGRNILIGIIVLVISVSACIGLSIRQASENARQETMENMSVTATINFDRQAMMSQLGRPDDKPQGEGRPSFDKNQFAQMMGASQALSLEEYQSYASSESVKDFYYVSTVSVNGSDDLLPVSTDTESSSDEETTYTQNDYMGMPGGFGQGGFGGKGMMGMSQSDFTLKGYSSDASMTDFQNGTASITDGAVFDEGTASMDCIISNELAVYNSIEVGNVIRISNPNSEDEVYELTVVGLFTDASANENSFSPMGFSSNDPANRIYMSYNALQEIVSTSESVSVTLTDENTGREYESALKSSLEATYVFADTDAYYQFEEDVRTLGLSEEYVVTSTDITAFENSLTPIKTLSSMAGWFLLIILIIGAVILIVLNIFSVRERKYEIGVLTAMGMKKSKVAVQFVSEIFIVTIIAVIIGIVIGGISAVPVTNALLENQATSQQNREDAFEMNFGRPGGGRGDFDMMGGPEMGDVPQNTPQGGGFGDFFAHAGDSVGNYITEINSAMNLTVVFQMFGIAVALTLFAGMASILFIMRYEPLKILANRD